MTIKTAIISDKRYTRHLTGSGHPETPRRVASIDQQLREAGLHQKDSLVSPRFASMSELTLCHDSRYIQLVKKECLNSMADGSVLLTTGDVHISPDSFEIACLAVGGVITAIDTVMTGKAKNAFCNIRPPGHHASCSKGEGFCLFNNVAIGARYAQDVYDLSRVAILDWDVHHGNGTQSLFHRDPSVYYMSTHQTPSYPGTGLAEERGVGNIRNYPISYGQNPRLEILKRFQVDLPRDMEQFRPELILISSGFDARIGDPLGFFNLTDEDFKELTESVLSLAEQYANGRLVSVLEGGYHLKGLASAAAHHVCALAGVSDV